MRVKSHSHNKTQQKAHPIHQWNDFVTSQQGTHCRPMHCSNQQVTTVCEKSVWYTLYKSKSLYKTELSNSPLEQNLRHNPMCVINEKTTVAVVTRTMTMWDNVFDYESYWLVLLNYIRAWTSRGSPPNTTIPYYMYFLVIHLHYIHGLILKMPLAVEISSRGSPRRRKSNSISFRPSRRFRIHFTLGRPGKFSKQAAFWRRLSELMVNAHASWRNSTGSKSKQHDSVLMQNWNVILLNFISFLHLVAPTERFLYGCYWDPTPERRVPWG